MTDAIEPWAVDEIRRRQLIAQSWAVHQASIHQAELHTLEAAQLAKSQQLQHLQSEHSTLNAQHVDVDA